MMKKRCYYEVLGLGLTATLYEIRHSFHKLALKWHPDKNPSFNAIEHFQEINEAYSILSHLSEKTWYDRHRETIVRNWNLGSRGENDFATIKMLAFGEFSFDLIAHAALGLTEHGNEFYSFYNNVFKAIKDGVEEMSLLDNKLANNTQIRVEKRVLVIDAPSFGDAETHLADVVQFYHYWENLARFIEDAWIKLCHPGSDAELRVISNEVYNEKRRLRKRYIKIVRYLIQCVKSQDPRYQKYLESQDVVITEKGSETIEEAEIMLKDILANGIQNLEMAGYGKINCFYWNAYEIDGLDCPEQMCLECWNWAASIIKSMFKVNLQNVNWSENMLKIFLQAIMQDKQDSYLVNLEDNEHQDFIMRPERESRRLRKANFRHKAGDFSEQLENAVVSMKNPFCKKKFFRKNVLIKKRENPNKNSIV